MKTGVSLKYFVTGCTCLPIAKTKVDLIKRTFLSLDLNQKNRNEHAILWYLQTIQKSENGGLLKTGGSHFLLV